MTETGIQWTDFSSNLLKYKDAAGKVVWGCAKVSPGCARCYAESIALRFKRGGPFAAAEVRKLTPFFDDAEATRLLRSKRLAGKKVFVDDMTDLFGEWVPDEIIDRHFAVFARRPDVTFQVLTKRPERMREYCNQRYMPGRVNDKAIASGLALAPVSDVWPLPNVWLGVNVEDQPRADERIPPLLQCPAAVRFLSVEPLLGPVDLLKHVGTVRDRKIPGQGIYMPPGIHWCIISGESGPHARPCHVEWVRDLVRRCKDAGVACFVKQLAADVRCQPSEAGWPADTKWFVGGTNRVGLRDPKGGNPIEWPEDIRVREFPK